MSVLHIVPGKTPEGYDKRTKLLFQRPVKFIMDDWPLQADCLRDAIEEAELMQDPVERIEVAH